MSARARLERHGEVLLVVLVGLLFVVQITSESHFAGSRAIALAAAAGFCLALLFVRRAPLVPLTAGVLLMVVSNQWVAPLANTGTFFVALVLTVYWAGRHLAGRRLVAAGALLVVALPLAAIEPGQPFSLSDAVFLAVALAGPFAAGQIIRRRHEQEHRLRGRATQLEIERDLRAREAVAEERASALSVHLAGLQLVLSQAPVPRRLSKACLRAASGSAGHQSVGRRRTRRCDALGRPNRIVGHSDEIRGDARLLLRPALTLDRAAEGSRGVRSALRR